MAKIKQKISITEEEDNKIRRQWDIQRGRWYFSVTDIMAVLTESVDARNYWKALKNRLKNSHNQLVTDCNQLKMTASDGKSYLVDVADASTLIKIIQVIAPYNVPPFKSWFEHVEVANSPKSEKSNLSIKEKTEEQNKTSNEEVSIDSEISTDIKILADIFENKNEIVVKLLIPGFESESLLVSTSMDTLTIKGSIKSPLRAIENFNEENLLTQELKWGSFYREIELPSFVDVDNVSATESHGLVTITLTKIDLEKTRFIKIKSN